MIPARGDRPKKTRITSFARWATSFPKLSLGRARPVATTRRIPDGTIVYCIGDIHGRDDLLREMAERVAADLKKQSFEHSVTVFLGDYIDRGPDSKAVVERLATGKWPTS